MNSCLVYQPLGGEIKATDFVALSDSDTIWYAKFEITNKQYRTFLNEIKDNEELYEKCQVRSEFWTKYTELALMEPQERNYFSHEAYNDFPVVNITPTAAEEFCKWLSHKRSNRRENIHFRLPTEAEFDRLLNSVAIKYDSDKIGDYEAFHFNLKFEGNYPADGEMYSVLANTRSSFNFKTTDGQYAQNILGVQHVVGNVHENLSSGTYIGGGWDSFPSEVTLEATFEQPDPRVGFRVVMVRPH